MGKDRDHNMPVPLLKQLSYGELVSGKDIGIKAALKSKFFGSSNFSINLTCGANVKDNKDRDDIALHISCREKEGWIINAFIQGKWGHEQKYPLNVEEDEDFYMRIQPTEDEFVIYVNGQRLCAFRYHIRLSAINHIYIEGNVQLHRVAMEGQYYMVPFEHKFKHFGQGSTLYITGKPNKNAKEFSIDLVADSEENIVLTISVRMKDKQVVRNTRVRGKWQDEEVSAPGFPFWENEEFDLIIDAAENYFHIIVDGTSFCKYQYRESPSAVRSLSITGDVELKSVYI